MMDLLVTGVTLSTTGIGTSGNDQVAIKASAYIVSGRFPTIDLCIGVQLVN